MSFIFMLYFFIQPVLIQIPSLLIFGGIWQWKK